jgi:DNA-3-methyladenine glycosylase
MILKKSFYNRPTLKVAQDLLGCLLVRKAPLIKGVGGILKYKIVETEAYVGPNDLASHASRGRTERNGVMFGEPGIIYVYFTYGMHYMLNIVTERKGYPAAVLIRAVEPIAAKITPEVRHRGGDVGLQKKQIGNRKSTIENQFNGPAKLTKALKIDKTFNHIPIYTKKHGLWIESRDENIKPKHKTKPNRKNHPRRH